ncbi:UvrABC system protein C [Bienertia sinuspersici]
MSADPSWKADGSFKGGFKNKLEEKMNEKFPGCGLKAVPHIESKIKWFKDKYNVLSEMFRTSGLSWDNEKHMILAIIFGADRATGVQSETFVQAIDNQEKETIELDKGDSDEDEDNGSVNQTRQSSPSEPSSKKAKKEKKSKGTRKEEEDV